VNEKRISVEPLSYGMTGFRIDDLFAKDFIEKLRKEMPTAMIIHFCIGFSDSKDFVAVSHDRRDGKYVLDRVDVEGDVENVEPLKRIVEILKKVVM